MSDITNLPVFPHTIGNLDDKPNLPPNQMKAAFEQDSMQLWEKIREVIPELNSKLPMDSDTAKTIIDAWLDDHPDATTTVEDGAITREKLNADLQGKTDAVATLNSNIGDKSSLATENKTDLVSAINEVNGHFTGGIGDAVSAWLAAHPEATTTVADESLAYNKLIKGTLGFVSYDMFGAACDGVTDDYTAIKACHDFANTYNLPVMNSGISFLIGTTHDPIEVKTSCFFNKCTLLLPGTTSGYVIYKIVNDTATVSYSSVPLSTYFSDLNTPVAGFEKKFISITYPYALGLVSTELTYNKEAYGQKKKIWSLQAYDGTASVDADVSDLDQPPITFSGLSIIVSADKIYGQAILCLRHNTHISDLCVNYETADGGISKGAVIAVSLCNNVTVDNMSYKGKTDGAVSYNYCIRFDRCTSCSLSNFIGNAKWHGFVSNQITDFTMSNCKTELFDTHSGLYGDVSIRDCRFSMPIALGYGWGNVDVCNCYSTDNLVSYRPDSALCYNGLISIRNCECESSKYLYDSSTNSGTTSIDNAFKTTAPRRIVIDTTKSKCWYTNVSSNDYHGPIDIVIRNASNALCGGSSSANVADSNVVFENCYIPSIGGRDGYVTYKAYNSKYNLGYHGNKIELHNCVLVANRTTVYSPGIKCFNCVITKTDVTAATAIDNIMYINCTGVLIAAKNMLAQGCYFTSNLGGSTFPQTGGIMFCTASGSVFGFTNIEMQRCFTPLGEQTNNVSGINFVNF